MNSVYSTPWKKGLKRAIQGRTSVFILADSNLPAEYLEEVVSQCEGDVPVHSFSLEGGEKIKTLEVAERVYQELIIAGAERKTLMVCLGGGTITDLGGYVATTFKRGLELVLLPTTLLAMVDAAIGGKNGVNLNTEKGCLKNQIGTFLESKFIGLNTVWLESLPEREIRSGWAEMVKHSLLCRTCEFSENLYVNQSVELGDLKDMIPESAEVKQMIVSEDPYETGSRASLNLGHTIAHAIEAIASNECEDVTHGEAVAWGLVFALECSTEFLDYEEEWRDRYSEMIIEGINAPITLHPAEQMWEVMLTDKKNQFNNVTDVLLHPSNSTKPPKVDFIWNKNEFTKKWEDFRKKHS